MPSLGEQVAILFILAIPISSVAWTVTHEEIVREPREYCISKSKTAQSMLVRKFFYLFTCEYCFSHWVTLLTLIVTDYKLIYDDWRGYPTALFALVYVANFYMSLFGRLRLEIREERLEIEELEDKLEKLKAARAQRVELTTKPRQIG
ncbi:MAG: hypothetical protein ACRD2N_21235 [Vicinamibacterales bacterium]